MKIGIKYCGGCNPSFDRIAAAEKIRERMKHETEYVSYTDPEADLILVMAGCSTACAELKGLDMKKVRILRSSSDAEDLDLHQMNKEKNGIA